MIRELVRHGNTVIFPASLDPDAVSVVKRLHAAGYDAYLVGGCVRDLLLGHIPKDFDISTEARPRQIRKVFRNCRVIGRRFKLAHVHFGEKIIEVATFRRTPEDDEGTEDVLIVRDNIFGTAEEDVERRDFTCNALLYDVRNDEVLDWVGGVQDLKDHVLRTVGDPTVRLAEDPVRMLRAVKFASRLGLHLDPALDQAMRDAAPLISRSAPARVIEEIYRQLTCGQAAVVLSMLIEYRLLAHLLPEIQTYWARHAEGLVAVGAAVDAIDGGKRRVSNAFLLAALCLEPWRATLDEPGDPTAHAHDMFHPMALRMSLPRNDVAQAKQMLVTQLRLVRRGRRRRFRMGEFLARPSTARAVQLLYLAARSGHADPEDHARWAHRLATRPTGQAAPGSRPSRPPRRAGAGRTRGTRSRPQAAGPAQPTLQPAPRPATPAQPDPSSSAAPANGVRPQATGPLRRLRGLVQRLLRRQETPVAKPSPPPAAEPTPSDREPGSADRSGPQRKRRRRRRRRPTSTSSATPASSPDTEAGVSSKAPSGDEATPPRQCEGQGRRKRSRRRRGKRAGDTTAKPRSPAASGRSKTRPRRASAPPKPTGPGQRAPEDVEDLFDW